MARPWTVEGVARLRRPITLNRTTLLIGLAVAVLVAFLLWGVAWNRAFEKGRQEAAKGFGQPAVTDPLKNKDIPVNPKLIGEPGKGSPPAQNSSKPDVRKPSPVPTNLAGEPKSPPASGADPRIVGHNYLILASKLDRETADRAVAFLAENGVPAFALAVAQGGGAANNGTSYSLIAKEGITPEQYKSRAPERVDLEAKVLRLGKVWQKEHKGGTDFSRYQWDKKKS